MFKNKKVLIAVIVVVLILAAAGGYFLLTRRSGQESQRPIQFPIIPTTEKIEISSVQTNNFLKNPIEVNSKGDTVFIQTKDYQIIYFPEGNLFTISILSSPFAEAKASAEKALLQRLGISQSDACKLNVSVNTPLFANPEEAGKTYKLSFCE